MSHSSTGSLTVLRRSTIVLCRNSATSANHQVNVELQRLVTILAYVTVPTGEHITHCSTCSSIRLFRPASRGKCHSCCYYAVKKSPSTIKLRHKICYNRWTNLVEMLPHTVCNKSIICAVKSSKLWDGYLSLCRVRACNSTVKGRGKFNFGV